MYLENAISPKNKFWKYIVGSIIIIFASFIGQIPLGIALIFKSFNSKKGFPTDEAQLMKMLNGNLTLFLMLFSFAVALLAIYLVVKHLHNQRFLTLTTSRNSVDWKRIFFSFGVWAVFTIISVAIGYFSEPENFVINFKPVPFLILLVISLIMIPIQTSTEEYVFRGYLMQGFAVGSLKKKFMIGVFYTFLFIPIYIIFETIINIQLTSVLYPFAQVILFFLSLSLIVLIDFILTKLNFFETDFYSKIHQKSKNKLIPLLTTSVIFGLLHIANPEVQKMGAITMVYYIGTGLLLGIMTLMDDGMELALGFHAANNLISALLITSDWTAFQTDSILKDKSTPSAGFEIILPVFIVFPLILFIFSKKYNWSNWKEKLFGKIEIENPNLKIESHEYTEL